MNNVKVQQEHLREWFEFLQTESHILKHNPGLLFQQAANEPDSTGPAQAAWGRQKSGLETRPWFHHVNKPQSRSACLMTLTGHRANVSDCAYSPDGGRIVSASWDKTLKLWDAKTGEELATCAGHADSVRACGFSPDGSRIISASRDATLKLWDAKTGAEIVTLAGSKDELAACRFTLDGEYIASISDPQTLKLWHLQTRLQVFEWSLSIEKYNVGAWSHDGRDFVVFDGSGCLGIFRLQNISLGPAVVTAWEHHPRRWIPWRRPTASLRAGCPLCHVWSEVPTSALGAVIPCPHCGGSLKFNVFTINADWRDGLE